MIEFILLFSFSGGILIGLVVVVLMVVYGWIVGINGIVGGLLILWFDGDWVWCGVFVVGMIVSLFVMFGVIG